MEIKHPLINKIDSEHYDSKGKPAIADFEDKYTVGELMVWAKITKAKYEHPARAAKGQVEADKRKAKTYGDYYEFLSEIAKYSLPIKNMVASKAYAKLGVEVVYE